MIAAHRTASLLLVAALAAAPGCRCGGAGTSDARADGGTDSAVVDFDPLTVPENAAAFPLGVGSGDADAESAIFWTRYAGTLPLRLRVLERPGAIGPPYAAMPVDAPTGPPNDGGLVKRAGDGLAAGAAFDYVFLEEDTAGAFVGRSPIGRLRTAPAAGTLAPVTFAISGDANENFRPYEILSAVAAEDAAFFVMNGDHVYADGSVTRDDYRGFYERNWSDPSWMALRATTPFYSVWDDHEVDNGWDPETVDPTQRANATAAYLEYTTVRENAAAPDRLWRSYRWGDTLELFLLDCRSERRASAGEYLSPEQMTWLEDGLAGSPAMFKLIVNSVPITDLGPFGQSDRWQGFPMDRDEILGFIAANAIPHVYWLSADIHISLIGALPEYGGHDIVSGPVGQVLIGFAAGILMLVPTVEYVSAEVFNYHLVTVDPLAVPPSLTVSMRDDTGAEFYTRTFTE